jgi:hypothetical protein
MICVGVVDVVIVVAGVTVVDDAMVDVGALVVAGATVVVTGVSLKPKS